jgi:hypothetical protein
MSSSGLLPRCAPLSAYERSLAVTGVPAFVVAMPGAAVCIRLDERGGADEPVRWAFPPLEYLRSDLAAGGDGDDVYVDPAFMAGSDEATATGPAQPPLPLPPARERATVTVVPGDGGRVGRASQSAVRIAERSVSRVHAMLTGVDGAWSVVDLESENGTGVNGLLLVPGVPHAIRSGDVLHLGDVSLLFLDVDSFAAFLPALTGR